MGGPVDSKKHPMPGQRFLPIGMGCFFVFGAGLVYGPGASRFRRAAQRAAPMGTRKYPPP